MNAQANGFHDTKDMSLDELFGDTPISGNEKASEYFSDILSNTQNKVKKILNIVVLPDDKGEKKIFVKKSNGEVWGGFDEVGKPMSLEDGREVFWTKDGENEMYLDILTGENILNTTFSERNAIIQ